MSTIPLWAVAEIRPSNVDKETVSGQPAVRLVNYTDVYKNVTITRGMDLMGASAPVDQIARFRVLPDDIILTKDSETPDDIGIPAIVQTATEEMVCGYHLTLLRPDANKVVPKFLYWFIESKIAKDYWLTHSNGVTRYSLLTGDVARLLLPALGQEEQRRIADYLDRETAEIDAMDADLDRVVDILRERDAAGREAALAQAFEGSCLRPLWSVITPIKEQNHPGEEVLSVYRDHGVVLKSSRDDNHNRTPEDLSNYQLVQSGYVVINKMKAWQGSLGVSSHRGIISPDYQVCRPVLDEVDPTYLHLVLRSPQMIPQYKVRSKGVRPSQWRLYWADMAPLLIPVPPLDEQRRIVAQIGVQTDEIDDVIDDAQRLKALLSERRSTLITEAVTGRMEVPA